MPGLAGRLIPILLLIAPPASAQNGFSQWRNPGGRLAFSRPAEWQVNTLQSEIPGAIRVFTGAADYECQIWSLPKQLTEIIAPEAVRERYMHPMSADQWRHTVEPLDYFGAGLEVGVPEVNAVGAWPIQRIKLHSGPRVVRGALQGRPGLELLSLCVSYDGQDRNAIFARIEASLNGVAPPPAV